MTVQYPRPDHFLLHISDTHLLAGSGRSTARSTARRHLRALLARSSAASGARPEAIVFTGDLADLGEPDAYARCERIVEPVAARLGAAVIWVMGNHDDRAAFRAGAVRRGTRQRDPSTACTTSTACA